MSFRVIYHQPVCPDCGSGQISTEDVDTTDGFTETAHICQRLRRRMAGRLHRRTPSARDHPRDRQSSPHLVLRIDARPPGTGPAGRLYWCPRCDVYLTGTELATTAIVHYTPGPDRTITEADLTPEAVTP